MAGFFFFPRSPFFTDVIYNSFHLPQRDHLEYCRDCVKLETSQRTLISWQSVSSSFAKFSRWPLDRSQEHAAWQSSLGDSSWLVKVKHYLDHFFICISILLVGMLFSWTKDLHGWPETCPSPLSPWLLDRLCGIFLIPCTHRRSRHFYHVLVNKGTLASTSHLCHMEPISMDWT